MNEFFKPEDFQLDQYEGVVLRGRVDPIKAAHIANAKLKEWLDKAPIIEYGIEHGLLILGSPKIKSGMRAKLVCIEEIK